MQAITASSILSVVSSLISKEEFAIFTSALQAGALYTGNSLGQILEYLITGREVLRHVNDFDLFTWLSNEELKAFEYTDYRGDSYYSIPEVYEVRMGLPEYSGKVSIVKIHSGAGNGTGAKGYFTNNPMANWVDCWMTKEEVYLGDSFKEFLLGKKLKLNRNNSYLMEAFPKFEKKLNQGYSCDWFLYPLSYRVSEEVKESYFYKIVQRTGTYWTDRVKYFSNLPPEILLTIANSRGYLERQVSWKSQEANWEKLQDLLIHYANLEENTHEWVKYLEVLNPIEFEGLDLGKIAYFCYQYYKVCSQVVKELGELVGGAEYQFYYQKKELSTVIQPTDRKWKLGLHPHQQMFKLLIAQGHTKLKYALLITPEEWRSGKVSKHTMLMMGVLKGSPKVSKVLLALGLNEKMVSIALGAGKVATSSKNRATTVRKDKQSFLEQGNSVYYSSCQATDPRASWTNGQHHNKIEGDLPFVGDTLFLWTIGSLMSEDEKGFVCRAKLRVLFKPTNEVLGLYIDRVYGNEGLLMEYLPELQDWWEEHSMTKWGKLTPLFMKSEEGTKVTFSSPSSENGYQDSLAVNNCILLIDLTVPRKSLLYQGYRSRDKSAGVYCRPLAEVKYNPQNGEFS